MTLRRKAARGLYGVVCGSYSISRYRDMTGIRRNRVIDHRGVFTAECGFIPDDRWRLGLRWVYAGGRPYAPLDPELSRLYNRLIFDVDRLNKERLPDYHVLDLQIGRRFRMRQSCLDVYISVWNVYNHRNIYASYWDTEERKEKYIYQWGILPLAGIEYSF